jgi:hypothetical protein
VSDQKETWLFGVYDGDTAGWSGTDTSRERAYAEKESGELSKRLEMIVERVKASGSAGMTWRELATETGLHHGQVSGALSNLHRKGLVFITDERRGRCHVYYHQHQAWRFLKRYDSPPMTSRATKQALLEELWEVVEEMVAADVRYGTTISTKVIDVLERLEEHERATTSARSKKR